MVEFKIASLKGMLQEIAQKIDKVNQEDGFIRGYEISLFHTTAKNYMKLGKISAKEYNSVFAPLERQRAPRQEIGNVVCQNDSIPDYNNRLAPKVNIPPAQIHKADVVVEKEPDSQELHDKMVSNLVESWNNKYKAHITKEFVEKLYEAIVLLDLTVDEKEWAKADKTQYSCKADYIVDKMLAMMANESQFNPKQWNGNAAVGILQMQQERLDEIRRVNSKEAKPGGRFEAKTLAEFAELPMEVQLDYFIEGIRISKANYSHINGPITVEQAYQMNHYPGEGKNMTAVAEKNSVIDDKKKDRGDLPSLT